MALASKDGSWCTDEGLMSYKSQPEARRMLIQPAGHEVLWMWTRDLTKKQPRWKTSKSLCARGGEHQHFM